MAKFIVTQDSYFRPFSYDELMKPVMLAQEAHNATQDAYDKMAMDTAALENYISKEGKDDARAREMYNNYKTKLQTLQDNLWANGVNAQTRRDLSAARNAYASDITRLAKAVESRQAASKAFWEAKRKDPSLITGADPGLSGLDKYLENDLYGQDYFAYSGIQFANEVGLEAKARAKEMLNDPEVSKDPNLQGYLLVKSRDGFTNQEVMKASDAVRRAVAGDSHAFDNLSTGEQILASVLSSNMNRLNAKDKISAEEFDRLLGYGINGLAQAVGDTKIERVSDKVYDEMQQRRNAEYQYELAARKEAAKEAAKAAAKQSASRQYNWNSNIDTMQSEGYEKMQGTIGKKMKAYASGSKTIARPDGTSVTFTSPFQAFEEIYNPKIRKQIRAEMYGLDVAEDGEQEFTMPLANGGTATFKTGKEINGIIPIKDKNGYIDKPMTIKFNKARNEYLRHVNAYKKANPKINLRDISIDLHEERSLRKDNEITPDVDSAYLEDIVLSRNYQREDSSHADIAPTGDAAAYVREDLTDKLMESIAYDKATSGGEQNSSSRYRFYKVGKGLTEKDKEGETDLKKVFGDKFNRKSILSISVNPEDILKNGRTMINIATGTGIWSVDARAFGDLIAGSRGVLGDISIGNGERVNIQQVIKSMMQPVEDVQTVMKMSDAEAAELTDLIRDVLGVSDMPDVRTIARSKENRNMLRTAIKDFMNDLFSTARDEINLNHMQHIGNTSSNSSSYLEE